MFDQKTQEALNSYVYALFDPADPTIPFYLGKGRGNRVFDHARGAVDSVDSEEGQSPKLRQIFNILASGKEVIHKIIRFNLEPDEALRMEATLIDLVNYMKPDQLTNEISGQGIAEGFYDARDLADTLSAERLDAGDAKVLLVKIERRWTALVEKHNSARAVPANEVFEATKGDWKLSIERAEKVDFVLAVARGLIRGVFVPTGWESAGYEDRKRMKGLHEKVTLPDFVGKSVAHIFSRGSQNPLRYLPR